MPHLLPLIALVTCFSGVLRAADPTSGSEQVRVETNYRYWQWLPEGYAQSTQSYPLILFLHGGGESGDDLELVKKHGLPKELLGGRKLPCIVLAPQNPDKLRLWDDRALMGFIEQRCKTLRVDPRRIYLAGMSRGAHGAYMLAVQNPGRFAAVAMVCGGGPVAYAKRAKDTPFWFFHGDRDRNVPTEESRRLHAALLDAGGNSKVTIYPDTAHDAWTKAFADDELYKWLLSKQLPESRR
jgi:predicted peptidase